MYNKSNLNNLISFVDNEIKSFANKFALEKVDFDTLTSSTSCLTNERTLSSYVNSILANKFVSDGCNVLLKVDEFEVIPNPAFKRNKARREVQGSRKVERPWKECFVDGYIKALGIVSPSIKTHLLIEYKINNKFVYLDLAKDYLKYKILTCQNYGTTIFAYVIFEDNSAYPSILCSKPDYYQLLNTTLRKKTIQKDKRVFIFAPNQVPASSSACNKPSDPKDDPVIKPDNTSPDNSGNQQDGTEKSGDTSSPDSDSKTTDVYNLLEDVSKLSNQVLEQKEKVTNLFTNNEMLFINNMKSFNTNVATSQFLRDYYPFLRRVWDRSIGNNFFARQIADFGNDIESIAKESGEYRKNVSDMITADSRLRASKDGLIVNTRVSLFIVSTIDYLNETFELGVEPPVYSSTFSGRGKNRHELKDIDAVNTFKTKLKRQYKGIIGKERIKRLSFCVLFYIIHLFDIIYDFDEKTGAIKDFKPSFKKYKLIGKLQSTIDELEKITSYNGEKIDVDSLLKEKSDKSSNSVVDLASHILSIY